MSTKDFAAIKLALIEMLREYMETAGRTSADAVELFLLQYPRASLDAEPVPSPHSEDFPTVHDGYVQAAIVGMFSNGNADTINRDLVEKCFKTADVCMEYRAARKASSTPEGAA